MSTVALNLSDLAPDEQYRYSTTLDDYNQDQTLYIGAAATALQNRSNQGIDRSNQGNDNKENIYQRELEKLMLRSKGTAYEGIIQKFVQSKSFDAPKNTSQFSNTQQTHFSENISPNKIRASSPRLDLFALNPSKYDDPELDTEKRPSIKLYASSPNLSLVFRATSSASPTRILDRDPQLSNKRLEDMAKPLERNVWRGRGHGDGTTPLKRTSTNHLGRQRPPPSNINTSPGPTPGIVSSNPKIATYSPGRHSTTLGNVSQNYNRSMSPRVDNRGSHSHSDRLGLDSLKGTLANTRGMAHSHIAMQYSPGRANLYSSRDTSPSTKVKSSYRSQSPSINRNGQPNFDKWIETNQSWKENLDAKIKAKKMEELELLSSRSTPRINKDRHSIKLAKQGCTSFVEKLSSDVESSASFTSAKRAGSAQRKYEGNDVNMPKDQQGVGTHDVSIKTDFITGWASARGRSRERETPAFGRHTTQNQGSRTRVRSLSPSVQIMPSESSSSLFERGTSPSSSVYDRLALGGYVKGQKLRSWTPPPKVGTFPPKLEERTAKLARKSRERRQKEKAMARSQSPKHMIRKYESSEINHQSMYLGSHSPSSLMSSRHSEQAFALTSPRISSLKNEGVVSLGSGGSTSLSPSETNSPNISPRVITRKNNAESSSFNNSNNNTAVSSRNNNNDGASSSKLYRRSRVQALSLCDLIEQPVEKQSIQSTEPKIYTDNQYLERKQQQYQITDEEIERAITKERVLSGIEKTRSRSIAAKEKSRRLLGKETRLFQSNNDSKAFQPILVAKETQRIMKRNPEKFEERVQKSVESFYVQQAVAIKNREMSPGPGHYRKTDKSIASQSPRSLSPTHSVASSVQSASTADICANQSSAGSKGFKWGKEPRKAIEPIKRVSMGSEGKTPAKHKRGMNTVGTEQEDGH